MSRTVRRSLDLFRLGIGGAAAVLVLAACGGSADGDPAGATPAAEASEERPTTADGVDDFCSQAAGIDERVDSAMSDLEGDPSLPDAFRRIADDLRTIEPPAAIASDWNAMADGLDRMAEAFGRVDVTDLDSLDELDRAEGDLTTVSDEVNQYLSDECGL